MKYILKLIENYPQSTKIVQRLAIALEAQKRLHLTEFVEPFSIVTKSKEGGELANLNSQLLDAWRQHAAFSNGIKMSTLEEVILRELCSGGLLAASILGRSHMEAAGQAALCQQQIDSCGKNNDLSSLQKVIPKYFMGASLKKESKLVKQVKGMEFFELPQNVMNAIDALDDFSMSQEIRKKQVMRQRYAQFCDFAHPLLNALSDFRSNEEISDLGWRIRYSSRETVSQARHERFLELFLDNVRIGWANVLMLAYSKFLQDEQYEIVYESPPKSELNWIFENLLFLERR